MKKAILLMVSLLLAISVQAQLSRVTGTVYGSDDNSPLVGATVKVVGTNIVVPTDVDGRFTITGLKPGMKKVEVSYIGYSPKEADIKENMKVYLDVQNQMMDEVIVVAFGKQKRESFTGSAAVVSADEIAQQQVTNPIEALNGRVAGMNMTMANSYTEDPTIRIRGISSLNASNAPLIVVDGLPYNGYYNDINPNDVESITVLKDAASNALYGARGANGVILITTKSGQRGKTKVNVEAKLGVNTDGRVKYNTINDPGQYYYAHYLAWRNYYVNALGQTNAEAHINANNKLGAPFGEGGLGYMVYSVPENQYLIGENGQLNPNASLGNRVMYNDQIYTLYPDNWLKEGIRDGFRQEYNVRMNGGNEQFTMLASIGYLGDEGISCGSNLKRFNARLKAEYQAYKWLRVGGTGTYTHTSTNSLDAVFGTPYTIGPIYPLYVRDAEGKIMTDSHGKVYDYGAGNNGGCSRPMDNNGNSIQEDLIDISNNSSNAFSLQGFATADLTHGLSLTVNGSTYVTENRIKSGYAPYYGYSAIDHGQVTTSHYRTTDINYQQLLNYNATFGKHTISALLGHEYYVTEQTSVWGSRLNVAIFDQNTELAGAIQVKDNGGSKSKYNVEGYLFRGQYDYDNRYFGSVSFRRDGSSRFDPDHRWGNFWSLGGAWILTREEWFPKTWMVNMLKVKLSYGEQGNDGIGSYRYIDTYDIKNTNNNVAYVFDSKGNKKISWETVGALNAGIEFELLNSRLNGSLEVYRRKTADMLMWVSTPYSIGYSGYYDNIGDMVNTGVELDLNATILQFRNFTWDVNLNLSWQKNKVASLPESSKKYEVGGYNGFISGDNFVGEGLPLYTWYLQRYAGVSENGESMWYYTDKEGELQTTTDYSSADYYLCGNALPKVYGGFGTTINFYGFDFTANFAYSIGGKKYDTAYQDMMAPPYSSYTGVAYHMDAFKAWTPENPNSEIPRWQYNDVDCAAQSDRFLKDASYLSLRSLNLGYTFGKNVTRKLQMERLRVYVSCENLAYWTCRKGFDPRVGLKYGSYGGYSPTTAISGGLSIQF